ncbi:hypothetical protein ACEU2D_17690 [Brevibacillus laterosporus]|uniref:hypothetical protein n=1 Tax=Brevibacillus laterosporus TaxID=1465 RepID=UPI0035A59332
MDEEEQVFINGIKRVNDEFNLNITDEKIWELIAWLNKKAIKVDEAVRGIKKMS